MVVRTMHLPLEERVSARKALLQPGGAAYATFAALEAKLSQHKTRFCFGEQPGLADAMVFVNLSHMCTGYASAPAPWSEKEHLS